VLRRELQYVYVCLRNWLDRWHDEKKPSCGLDNFLVMHVRTFFFFNVQWGPTRSIGRLLTVVCCRSLPSDLQRRDAP